MKKKLILMLTMLALLLCVLAISVSAARVENYEDTYTLVKTTNIQQIYRHYTSETAFSRMWYTDTITVQFLDEDDNNIDVVPLWEYDENDGRYYSLVWYISNWSFVTEKEDVTKNDVTTQRDKYISAVYTLSKIRAVDLRYDTSYSENRSFKTSTVGYDYSLSISKPLWGIFYDVNNTPDDKTDDIKLQGATGMGRDINDYNRIGFEEQFDEIGNKIVVANLRDCTKETFDADCTGNYGTKTTWYLATNLQCLYYHDEFKYLVGGIGPVYEIDLGDGLEVINCQILRDNKKVEKLVLPNSLVYLGGECFRGSTVKTLVIGEGLLYAPSNVAQWKSGAFENIYVSKNILSSFQGYLTKYEYNGSAILGSLGTTNIYFDGNEEQATALVNRMIEENSSLNGKVTAVDYKTQPEREGLKNVVVFYNYNTCDAFHMGQHQWTGERIIVKDYFKEITFENSCTLCLSNIIDTSKTIAPLFTWKGYTVSTFGDTYSMAQGFLIDNEAIEKYKEYVPDFEFGLIVAGNVEGGAIAPELKGDMCIPQGKIAHNYFDIKISGITEAYANSNIIFCVYVKAQDNVYYLDNEKTSEKVTGVTFSYVSELK